MTINTGITRLLDFELTGNKNLPNGYAGLDGFGLIAASQIPDLFVKIAGDQMTGDLEIIDTFGLRVKDGANYAYINQTAGNSFFYGSGTIKFYDVGIPAGISLANLNKFITKSDVPATYVGSGSYYVCVNAGETALEFVAAGGIPGGPYLPLVAGGTNPLIGYLKIKTDTGGLYFYTAANAAYGNLYPDSNSFNLTGTSAQDLVLGTGTGKTIINHINASPKLTIADASITSTVPHTMQTDSAALYFKNTLGTAKGALIPYDTNLLLASAITQDLVLDTGAAGKNIYLDTDGTPRLTIADAGITAAKPLAMGANKITGLAAGTVNGDALRYEQLIGLYLLLTGGTLTGPITIQNDSAALYFKNTAGTATGALIPYGANLDLISSAAQDLVLDTGAAGKNIYLDTNGTLRLTIADAAITSTVPHTIKTDSAALYFKNTAGTATGALIPYAASLQLVGSSAQDVILDTGVNTKNVIIKNAATIIATVTKDNITMAKPIAMGTSKITGLAAGTTNGDATRYEQVLLLTGGTMSGAIAMGASKITGLAAATTNGDAVRYEQITGLVGNSGLGYWRRFWHADWFGHSGTWSWTNSALQTTYSSDAGGAESAGYFENDGTHANGDYTTWSAYLPVGTYSYEIISLKASNSAIMQFNVDATQIFSTDMYAAAEADNQSLTGTFSITTFTSHTLQLKANGKNASSSSYYVRVSKFTIEKIS